MKKTYGKKRRLKLKNKNETNPQIWSTAFLEKNSEYASSDILANLTKLDQTGQAAVEQHAVRVLTDSQLKQHEKIRNGAVRLIVALLPKTFPALEKVLSDCSSRLWYEVHFTTFSALDRDDLSEPDQERVLALVEQYLMNVKFEAGFAAWKAGDMLGDEWYAPETVRILERLVTSARYVAGRKGALHGIQHAITEATVFEKQHLLALVRRVASEDPSAEVRDYANYTLTDGGCSKHSSGKRVTS